ncbi:MAG: zinc ribbon domain-containing protein [Oscillospiraceae bacterium]|nr:zinc ribbon domain-containing protein [Candidatus Equicaccousia limihippi]
MYCTSCGIQNDDGAKFCSNCGAPLKTAPQPVFHAPAEPAVMPPPTDFQPTEYTEPVQSEPVFEQPAAEYDLPPEPEFKQQMFEQSRQDGEGIYGQQNSNVSQTYYPPTYNAVMGTIKNIGSSGKFQAAAIIYTAVSAVMVLLPFMLHSLIMVFAEVTGSYNTARAVESSSVTTSLFSLVVPALTAIGLWMFRVSCKNPAHRVKTGGMTVLKAVSIIQLVFACIASGIVLLAVISLSYTKEFYGYMPLTVIGCLFILGIMALIIITYVKKLQTVNAVIDSIKTGIPSQNASGFYGVMKYIGGVMYIIGAALVLLGGLVAIAAATTGALARFDASDITVFFALAVIGGYAAYNFLIGGLIFDFKHEMEAIKMQNDLMMQEQPTQQ